MITHLQAALKGASIWGAMISRGTHTLGFAVCSSPSPPSGNIKQVPKGKIKTRWRVRASPHQQFQVLPRTQQEPGVRAGPRAHRPQSNALGLCRLRSVRALQALDNSVSRTPQAAGRTSVRKVQLAWITAPVIPCESQSSAVFHLFGMWGWGFHV